MLPPPFILTTACAFATLARCHPWPALSGSEGGSVPRSLSSDAEICDLSRVQMPVAPTPLPSPPAGARLVIVAIGRGVQNYTCAAASSSDTPTPIGAVAYLYDTSCIAANHPDVLSALPALALQLPDPVQSSSGFDALNIDLIGDHFFANPTTPVFDLNVNPHRQEGVVVGTKVANSTAPAGPTLGGNGAVPWLFLKATAATTGDIRGMYRLQTAGGSAPKSCESLPSVFSVQYAAEYWFYM